MSFSIESESMHGGAQVAQTKGFTTEISNLDLMRSFAVVLVVARHVLSKIEDPTSAVFHPQAMGIFGVLIFFVHTSLVLMMSIERNETKSNSSFLTKYISFETRRAFRIYPLSILLVLLCYFVFIPNGLFSHEARGLKMLLTNLTLTQNIFKSPSIIGPLWTLPIEVQMYLFLPPLFVAVKKLGWKKTGLYVWIPALALAILRIKVSAIPEIFTHAPFFISGVMAFDALSTSSRRLPFWALHVGILVVLVSYMAAYKRFGGQFIWGYPACLAIAALIVNSKDIPQKLHWLASIGKTSAKYSYGVYLFHVPILMAVFRTPESLSEIWRWPVFIGSVGIVSALLYHLLELPFMQLGAKVAKRIAS